MCNRLLSIFDYDFLSDYPSPMHDIGMHYAQHFQVMLERGVCELAHSSFIIFFINALSYKKSYIIIYLID